MRILLIEDDDDKRIKIIEALGDFSNQLYIDEARSLNGGLRMLIKGKNIYSCVLLDMSMPNYDVTPEEPTGGTPESFAGRELLSQMKLRGINIPTIVITMFDAFGDAPNKTSLKELCDQLKERFSPFFIGAIYYSSSQDEWRFKLYEALKGVL